MSIASIPPHPVAASAVFASTTTAGAIVQPYVQHILY